MSQQTTGKESTYLTGKNFLILAAVAVLITITLFLAIPHQKYEVADLQDAHQLMERLFQQLSSEPYYTDAEGNAPGSAAFNANFLRNLQLHAPTSSAVVSSTNDTSVSIVKHVSNLLLNNMQALQADPSGSIGDNSHPQLSSSPLFTFEDLGHRWGYLDFPQVQAKGNFSTDMVQEFALRYIQAIYGEVSVSDRANVSEWQLANAFYTQHFDGMMEVFAEAHQDGYHERSVNEEIKTLSDGSASVAAWHQSASLGTDQGTDHSVFTTALTKGSSEEKAEFVIRLEQEYYARLLGVRPGLLTMSQADIKGGLTIPAADAADFMPSLLQNADVITQIGAAYEVLDAVRTEYLGADGKVDPANFSGLTANTAQLPIGGATTPPQTPEQNYAAWKAEVVIIVNTAANNVATEAQWNAAFDVLFLPELLAWYNGLAANDGTDLVIS